MDGHYIKRMAKRQRVIALSSAEAELYAAVAMSSETLGIQSLGKDMKLDLNATLGVDASAALSLMSKEGPGKANHIHVQNLWIQEASITK